MPDTPNAIHLAVALDGAGWRPSARREPDARPAGSFSANCSGEAEADLPDFATIEDGPALQSDDHFRADNRTDRVRGRLDAVLIAARVALTTRHLGFAPTAMITHDHADRVRTYELLVDEWGKR